jgi:hypothetical protein
VEILSQRSTRKREKRIVKYDAEEEKREEEGKRRPPGKERKRFFVVYRI